jgi:outer membrane autotransporter protein
VDGDAYQVIDADGSQFHDNTLFTLPSTWSTKFEQEIRSDGYWITWVSTGTGFADAVRGYATPNAYQVAVGFDKLGLPSNFFGNMSESELADTLAQLHGEVFATSKEAAVQMQQRFQTLLPNGRDFYNISALPKLWNRWGTFIGDYNNRKHLGRNIVDRYSGYEMSSAGLAIGVDKTISSFGLCGVALGYDYADQKFRSIRSRAEIEAFRAMVYNSWFNGDYYCDTYVGYTKNWYTTNRNIDIGTGAFSFSETAKSKYDDDMGSVGVDIGRTWSLGWSILTPSVGIHYNFISSPTVVEEGSGLGLRVASSDYHSVRLPAGVKLSKMFPWDHGSVWMPELRAYYTRELANDTVKVRTAFAEAPGVDFVATSGVRGRDSVRVGLGLGFLVASRVNFRLDYDCDIYNDTTADSFGVTLGVSW